MTTSAWPRQRRPRTVINPGSPGPAPMRYTIGFFIAASATCSVEFLLGAAHVFENRPGAVGDELSSEARTQRGGFAPRRAIPAAHHSESIQRDYHCVQVEVAAIGDRHRSDRCLAASTERRDQRPLRRDGARRLRVVDGRQRLTRPPIVHAHLDRCLLYT